MFWSRKPRSPVFTGQEITALIILAASIDTSEYVFTDPQLQAVVDKAKSLCERREKVNGRHTIYCPPIEIVS
jgi:hypothetical protein